MYLKRTLLVFTIFFSAFDLRANSEKLSRLWNLDTESNYDIPSEEEVQLAEEKIRSQKFVSLPQLTIAGRSQVLRRYMHLDPDEVVPQDLLERAVLYFDANKSALANQEYISVVDFSSRSNLQRFFIVNMISGEVMPIRTAHGVGSDPDHDGFVESLGNVPDSKKSSQGFYQVSEIYSGKYGRSIRLDGLSPTNSNVRRRAIVIHGSDYVHEGNVIQGRSWGCFALAWSIKDHVVDLLSGGSLLYADFSKS